MSFNINSEQCVEPQAGTMKLTTAARSCDVSVTLLQSVSQLRGGLLIEEAVFASVYEHCVSIPI